MQPVIAFSFNSRPDSKDITIHYAKLAAAAYQVRIVMGGSGTALLPEYTFDCASSSMSLTILGLPSILLIDITTFVKPSELTAHSLSETIEFGSPYFMLEPLLCMLPTSDDALSVSITSVRSLRRMIRCVHHQHQK